MSDLPRPLDDQPAPRQGFIALQMTGQTPQTWAELRLTLIAKIVELVDQVGREKPTTDCLKEQAREIGSLGLDHVKAKLEKPSLENEQIIANVSKTYAEVEKIKAEARKTDSEADAKEFENSIKQLRAMLKVSRVMMLQSVQGEEVSLLGQEIETLFQTLKELEST